MVWEGGRDGEALQPELAGVRLTWGLAWRLEAEKGCRERAKAGDMESTSSKDSVREAGVLVLGSRSHGTEVARSGFLEPERYPEVGIPRGESKTHPNSVGTETRSLCALLAAVPKARAMSGEGELQFENVGTCIQNPEVHLGLDAQKWREILGMMVSNGNAL